MILSSFTGLKLVAYYFNLYLPLLLALIVDSIDIR